MLMRERSGRSGRRRGSQKPGTASGSAAVADAGGGTTAGAGLGACFVACANTDVAVKTVSVTANVHAAPSRQRAELNLIRRPLIRNRGEHSITAALAESRSQHFY